MSKSGADIEGVHYNEEIDWVPWVSSDRRKFVLTLTSENAMNHDDIIWALAWYLEEITKAIHARKTKDPPSN